MASKLVHFNVHLLSWSVLSLKSRHFNSMLDLMKLVYEWNLNYSTEMKLFQVR